MEVSGILADGSWSVVADGSCRLLGLASPRLTQTDLSNCEVDSTRGLLSTSFVTLGINDTVPGMDLGGG